MSVLNTQSAYIILVILMISYLIMKGCRVMARQEKSQKAILSNTLKVRALTMMIPISLLLLKAVYYAINGYSGALEFGLVGLMWLAAVALIENRRRALRGHRFIALPLARFAGMIASGLVGVSLLYGY